MYCNKNCFANSLISNSSNHDYTNTICELESSCSAKSSKNFESWEETISLFSVL